MQPIARPLLETRVTQQQRTRTLAGIKAALAAIEDNTPVTPAERREHQRLVARELARYAQRQSAQPDLGLR